MNIEMQICLLLNVMLIISIAASIIKRKSIGAWLSPRFMSTIDSNSIVVLPFLNLILVTLLCHFSEFVRGGSYSRYQKLLLSR